MATRTAAAGGGNWTAGATWVGGVAPTAADDVLLTGTSGNVTIDSGAVCRSLNCTGYTGTLTHNTAVTLTIGDGTAGLSNVALLLVSGMTYTKGGVSTSAISFVSTSATVQTLDAGGKVLGNITFSGATGSWQVSGTFDLATAATLTLTAGSLDINGKTCSWGQFNSNNTNTRSLTLGVASITILGSGTAWNISNSTNMNLSAGTATVTLSAASAGIAVGNTPLVWATGSTIAFTGGGSNNLFGTSQLGNLTYIGTAVKTNSFLISSSHTITGTLTVSGQNAINRVLLSSATLGTQITLTNNGSNVFSNVDFEDIAAAGSASWNLSAITGGSGDASGNSGITFTPAATQTWSGTSGGNWSTNAWTTRVPLPQDSVIVSSAFIAGQTISADMPRLGGNIDWTGSTGGPIWSTALATFIFGSVTLAAGQVFNAAVGNVTFSGRSTHTITSNGVAFSLSVIIAGPGGTYTLNDSFNVSGLSGLAINNGTFNANNFNVTTTLVTSNGTLTRSIIMGTGTWSLTSTAAVSIFSLNGVGLTFSGASSVITIVNPSANSRTIDQASFTFGTLNYTVAGSTGMLILSSNGTWNTINFSDASNARTLRMQSARTLTILGAFNVRGTAGKLMSLISDSAGVAFIVSKSAGIVSEDYVSIQDSTAQGGATFYAGANSTDVSGNTGWIFSAAPAASGSNVLLMGVG